MDQDVGLVDDRFHRLGVGDEVGGDVAPVELHALDVLGLELQALALLDGDDAVLADLVHHLGDQLADLAVLGRDGGHVGDLVLGGQLDRLVGEGTHHGLGSSQDAALEQHRVGAGGYVLHPLGDDGVGQHGGGGGAVTGDVVGLGGRFLEQLRPHVLEGIFQLDLLGYRHAIVGDGGSAPLLVERHVAPLGAQRGDDSGRQRVDPAFEGASSFLTEN